MIPSEIEALRQETLAGLKDLCEDEGLEALFARHAPGSFGMHEALHMSSFFLDALDRALLEHPALVAHPDLFAKACAVHTALFRLYQAIGAVHVADETAPEASEAD